MHMPRNLEVIRAHQKEKTLLNDKIINQDVRLSTFGFPHLTRQESCAIRNSALKIIQYSTQEPTCTKANPKNKLLLVLSQRL